MSEKEINQNSSIGVLDSGLGGLGFLRGARKILWHESWVYYADQGNWPYGTKSRDEIKALVTEGVRWLGEEKGVKAVVLACNTATAVTVGVLREKWPELVIVGMEPEIKTALRETNEDEMVLMMATEATCGLEKYLDLKRDLDDEERVREIPSPELVELVENGANTSEYEKVLEKLIGKYRNENVGAIVLGCTHFIFTEELIKNYIERNWQREVKFFNGVEGTAKRLRNLLNQADLLKVRKDEESREVELWTTGVEKEMNVARMKELLERGN